MKSIAFVVFCLLCTLTQVAYATEGGESENTNCNGVGNPNSYCDGTEEVPEPPVCENPTPTVHNHVCIVPTHAVTSYLATNFVFNSDPKACEKQCKSIVKGCSGVARAQGKCYSSVIRSAQKHALANCKTLADKALRAQCVAGVRTNSTANLEVFRADTIEARAFCTDTVAECVAACND